MGGKIDLQIYRETSKKTVARNSVLNPKTTFKKSQENTENKKPRCVHSTEFH